MNIVELNALKELPREEQVRRVAADLSCRRIHGQLNPNTIPKDEWEFFVNFVSDSENCRIRVEQAKEI